MQRAGRVWYPKSDLRSGGTFRVVVTSGQKGTRIKLAGSVSSYVGVFTNVHQG